MRSNPVKILALSDLHGACERIPCILEHAGNADLIILAGDITHFGHTQEARLLVEAFHEKGYAETPFLAIPGNCDFPDIEPWLEKSGISAHRKISIACGIQFVGLGRSLPCPGRTPNESSEEEMELWLDEAEKKVDPAFPLVLIVHHPPWNTHADRVMSGIHVGSHSIRNFIEKVQPIVCFSGHIHESRGIDMLGRTHILNAGPALAGYYAMALIRDGAAEVFLRNCDVPPCPVT